MTERAVGNRGRLVLKGTVVSGRGEGRFFTRLPWAREQFVSKLGIDPYPGTLNVRLDVPEALRQWQTLKSRPGVTIIPPKAAGACNARCYAVLVQTKLPGAIVFPEVPDYPPDKLEIIATWNLKEVLAIRDGEEIRLDWTV